MGSELSYSVPVAVYDASVLFPFHVAHLLTFMATRRLVHARWTRAIEEEWVERSLEKLAGLKRESVERRTDAMNRALPHALVSNYEHHIETIVFPDPDDRHVVAAALECKASVIVTRDKKHFTAGTLGPYGLRRMYPDDFLCDRLTDLPERVLDVVEQARLALGRSKPDAVSYIQIIDEAGLHGFAFQLKATAYGM